MKEHKIIFSKSLDELENNNKMLPEIQSVINWYKTYTQNKLSINSDIQTEINESVDKLVKVNQFLEPIFEWSTTQNLINNILNDLTEESYNNFKNKFEKIYWIKVNNNFLSIPFFTLLDMLNYISENKEELDPKIINNYYNNFKLKVIEYHKLQNYSK